MPAPAPSSGSTFAGLFGGGAGGFGGGMGNIGSFLQPMQPGMMAPPGPLDGGGGGYSGMPIGGGGMFGGMPMTPQPSQPPMMPQPSQQPPSMSLMQQLQAILGRGGPAPAPTPMARGGMVMPQFQRPMMRPMPFMGNFAGGMGMR